MIIIHNIGGDLSGVCRYQVRINKEVICEFEHNRMDGLGMCFLEASKAVERAKWKKLEDLYKNLKVN